jgi:hypothetical protein
MCIVSDEIQMCIASLQRNSYRQNQRMVSSSYPNFPRHKKGEKKVNNIWSEGTVIKCSTSLTNNNGPLHLKRKLHQVIKLRSNYDWNKRLRRSLKQNYVQYSTKNHEGCPFFFIYRTTKKYMIKIPIFTVTDLAVVSLYQRALTCTE